MMICKMENNAAVARKLAAYMWDYVYPRRNFFDTDSANQRKWISLAEDLINNKQKIDAMISGCS